MDILIVILFIVLPLVFNSKKKAARQQMTRQQQTTPQNVRPQNAGTQSVRPQNVRSQNAGPQSIRPQNAGQQNTYSQGQWVQQELDLQQMDPQEKMRQKKAELQKKYGTAVQGGFVQKTDIVDRAKLNNARLAEDETLKEIESLHGHKETHKPEKMEHEENAIQAGDSLLGSIDDLMVKGYSGSLDFDRDFVGEAMDMIASFTVPDTVPDMVPDVMIDTEFDVAARNEIHECA